MSTVQWHALGEMVRQWAQIVAHVERGYTLTLDDYLNDLDLRRLIDERIRELINLDEGVMPEVIGVALSNADNRFRQATVASDENVWGDENAREEGWSAEREWYYYRVPEHLPDAW